MDKIEANGRTLEEAVQMAAQQLGVGVDGVDYEVSEEGTKGFLGLGQTPTVINAWVKEGYVQSAPPAFVAEEPEVEEAIEERPAAQYKEPAALASKAAPVVEHSDDPFIDALMQTTGEILHAMRLEAKPVLRHSSDDEVLVDLVGPDVAILIGKQGQTLDAMQYLVGIIANRSVESRRRVILDAEHYRDRHAELLERKAKDYARAVKKEGQEAVLEPQSPRDRRIIHVALADDPDVYTYSEGEGDDRHVVISPKK